MVVVEDKNVNVDQIRVDQRLFSTRLSQVSTTVNEVLKDLHCRLIASARQVSKVMK